MIANHCFILRLAVALGLGISLAGTGPAVRGQEAPWAFVQWKPLADGPVFKGTGSETWDRKIRETRIHLARR